MRSVSVRYDQSNPNGLLFAAAPRRLEGTDHSSRGSPLTTARWRACGQAYLKLGEPFNQIETTIRQLDEVNNGWTKKLIRLNELMNKVDVKVADYWKK